MQKPLWSNFTLLVSSLVLTHTMNAQHIPSSQSEQRAVFKELRFLNQNFENPVKRKNGFSLVAATYETYNATAQFVKAADSTRYKWVGNRGEVFDIIIYTGMANPMSYGGELFDPLTDASEIKNALYNYDSTEYYRLLLNTNAYGDLYRRRVAELGTNNTVSAYTETRLVNNNWQESNMTSHFFDNQSRLIEVLEKRNQNGSLTNYSKLTYAYNPADKIEMINSYLWVGGTWAISYKYSYAYDTNNNLIEYAVEQWQNNNWAKLTRVLFDYNSNNKVISRISQMGATGAWENSRIWHYNYTNDLLTTIETLSWASGTWSDITGLYEYGYNNQNQCVSKTAYVISLQDTTIQRMVFNYNAVNELESIVWQTGGPDGENFEDAERWFFEYGQAGLTGYYSQRKQNNTWAFFYGGPILGDQSFFNHYYYSDTNTTSISNAKSVTLNFAVYPNPGATNLSVAINKDAIKYMVITDLSGKEVLKTNFTQKVSKAEIDISGIAAGNYILTVGNESEYGVKQISIVK